MYSLYASHMVLRCFEQDDEKEISPTPWNQSGIYTNSDEGGIPRPSQNTTRNKAPAHVAECLQGVFDDKMVESSVFFRWKDSLTLSV